MKTYTVFDQKSRISEINRLAGESPVRVDRNTFEILSLAKRYAAETYGAFDITYGPLSSLWRKAIRSHTLPDRREILELRKSCGIDGLVLDETESTAYLKHRGMSIDLGGIAKGWAADEAGRIMRGYDIEHAQDLLL
jgi:thiamine biosynthesis lipoprotein